MSDDLSSAALVDAVMRSTTAEIADLLAAKDAYINSLHVCIRHALAELLAGNLHEATGWLEEANL